jgi:hypothetical protein
LDDGPLRRANFHENFGLGGFMSVGFPYVMKTALIRTIRERGWALIFPMATLPLLLYLSSSPVGSFMARQYGFPPELYRLLAVLVLIIPFSAFTLTYLNSGFADGVYSSTRWDERGAIDHTIARLRRDVLGLSSELEEVRGELRQVQQVEPMSGLDQEALVAKILDQAGNEAAQALVNKVEERVAENIRYTAPMRLVTDIFGYSLERLSGEKEALARRGNLNLLLGGITTISGLIVLGYFVFNDTYRAIEPTTFAVHFLPRVTLVLFIQAFAYFFLRLYKASLGEIKYFQNEITTLQQREASLLASIELADAATTKEVVLILAKTDRNTIPLATGSIEDKGDGSAQEALIEISKQLAKMIPQKTSA